MSRKFIQFNGKLYNISNIKEMYRKGGQYCIKIPHVNDFPYNSIKYDIIIESDNPGKNFIKFYNKCMKPIKEDPLLKRIKELEDKYTNLENAIKFLPVVSNEYKNAEENFNQKSIQ